MIVVRRGPFAIGVLLTVSFFIVLVAIFLPLFGEERNGLQFADDVFNRLSKGSSYFMPKVAKAVTGMYGKVLDLGIRLDDAETTERAVVVLTKSGVAIRREDGRLVLQGDLGQLLAQALRDAEDGYRNAEPVLADRYGMPARWVLATWWRVLAQMDTVLKKEQRWTEARAVREVMKKAIEPAHNYFGIQAERIGDMAGTMTALLLFYVVYTIWWGSAIYFLFEGAGLTMRRG